MERTRKVLAVLALIASLVLADSAANAGGSTTTVWMSKLLKVTYTPHGGLSTPGTYKFKNRNEKKKVRFACVWSRTGDPYQPPFFVNWESSLKPGKSKTYGDWGPPAHITCGAAREEWPTLALLDSLATEFSSDTLQVVWGTQCAPRAETNCRTGLTLINRVHALTIVDCSWTTGGGTKPGSVSADLSPYVPYPAGFLEPDAGSLNCVTS
jgi:hypothetical protein